MAQRKKLQTEGPTYNIEGGVHAERDVIMGNQINYLSKQVEEVHSPADFIQALNDIQKTLAELKAQPNLTKPQANNLEAAKEKVDEAAEKAASEKPPANEIQADLKEAQETMDLLSKGIGTAVQLGTMLGNLALMAVKIFGG